MNQRLRPSFLAVAVVLVVLFAAPAAHAAEPASGGLAKPNSSLTWVGGPYTVGVPNQLGCVTADNPSCDAFALTVNLKPGSRFAVAISSEIEGDDYDLYVYYPDGTEAGRSANSGGNESLVLQHTALHGIGPYRVRVLPFSVTSGSSYQGVAHATRAAAVEAEDPNACLEAVPAAVGIAGVTDSGQTVSLDVAVLLDGISVGQGDQIMTKAKESYSPLHVNLNVVSYRSVSFTGTEGADIIQQAKSYYGGVRPKGADVVFVLTNKDITTDGDTSLAGLADCIGGVRFANHAFGVGEAVGIEPFALGPFTLEVDAHPEIAAHEIGHLMGAHHHYGNCVEGVLQGEPTDLSPCTLMFNFVDFQSLNFSTLEGTAVRGHAVQYASP